MRSFANNLIDKLTDSDDLKQVASVLGSPNYPSRSFFHVPGTLSHDTRVALNLPADISKNKANTKPASDH